MEGALTAGRSLASMPCPKCSGTRRHPAIGPAGAGAAHYSERRTSIGAMRVARRAGT